MIHESGGMYDDATTEATDAGPPASSSVVKSASDLTTIEEEALAVTQKWVRHVPTVFKGNYPYQNPGYVNKPVSPGALTRGTGQSRVRMVTCLNCYARGHMAADCRLDFETNAHQVIANYEG